MPTSSTGRLFFFLICCRYSSESNSVVAPFVGLFFQTRAGDVCNIFYIYGFVVESLVRLFWKPTDAGVRRNKASWSDL